MKRTILILACLGTVLLSASAFAKFNDQNDSMTQVSVTDSVYGKDEILK
jgi:hypothetical protein